MVWSDLSRGQRGDNSKHQSADRSRSLSKAAVVVLFPHYNMPRPTTKTALVESSESGFQKLQKLIASLSEQEQESDFSFDTEFLAHQKEAHWQRDKNLRDILVHLYERHQLLLSWIKANQKGNSQPFLPPPYTRKTYGEMNRALRKKHQKTSLQTTKELLEKSHSQVLNLIETFSEEELFTKAYFSWTGTTSLGAYCISATSSHYDWAIKKLKKAFISKK